MELYLRLGGGLIATVHNPEAMKRHEVRLKLAERHDDNAKDTK